MARAPFAETVPTSLGPSHQPVNGIAPLFNPGGGHLRNPSRPLATVLAGTDVQHAETQRGRLDQPGGRVARKKPVVCPLDRLQERQESLPRQVFAEKPFSIAKVAGRDLARAPQHAHLRGTVRQSQVLSSVIGSTYPKINAPADDRVSRIAVGRQRQDVAWCGL